MTLEELKVLCDEYDAEYGEYPENILEGVAVYEFIKKKLTSDNTAKVEICHYCKGTSKLSPVA